MIETVNATPVNDQGTGITATPSPTLPGVSQTTSSPSTTGTVPGKVVTDSPLVRTQSDSSSALPSGSAFSRNSSYSTSVTQSLSGTTVGSAVNTKSVLPSPTTNDDTPAQSSQESTYNSLVNFYFLILAGFIGFAILGWWYWRRRRRGKTTRDQRRGLDALRRDLELGRLRRGFLGVMGRGENTAHGSVIEELPTFVL